MATTVVGMTSKADPQQVRDAMYGHVNLGGFALFSGGFINYGYWPSPLPSGAISHRARTESQAELYRQVVSRLNVSEQDTLLELGVGIGAGAVTVIDEFRPARLFGVDLSTEQIERARQTIAGTDAADRIELRRGSVTALPLQDGSCEGVYSIEVLQHVDDLGAVATEVERVLKPKGRFCAATFFGSGGLDPSGLTELLETVGNGADVIRPVDDFAAALTEAGLRNVEVTNVGDHVWRAWTVGFLKPSLPTRGHATGFGPGVTVSSTTTW